MVVEFLTFAIDPVELDDWLDVDERTWTRFLSAQPGFVSKHVWLDREHPGTVHAAITWHDERSWRAIPAEQLVEVDRSMGSWLRAPTCRTFDLVRSHPTR